MSTKKAPSPRLLLQTLRNGIIARNPVLVAAMGICPVVAAGTTLKNGVTLSLILGALLIPSCVLSSCLYRRLPRWARMPVMVMTAALLYCGIAWVLGQITYNMPAALGIYAPVLVVNSIITSRSEKFSIHHSVLTALADGVSCALGFALVTCICSAFRELLAYGTLWGRVILPEYQNVLAVAMPCFGFIALGYLAAAVKGVRFLRAGRRKKREKPNEP